MTETCRTTALKADSNNPSIMYTLHTISQMSKAEIELLKKLSKNRGASTSFSKDEEETLSRILEGFNVKTIQEVITVMQQLKLFDLGGF